MDTGQKGGLLYGTLIGVFFCPRSTADRAASSGQDSQCGKSMCISGFCFILPAHLEGKESVKLDSASVCGAGNERP